MKIKFCTYLSRLRQERRLELNYEEFVEQTFRRHATGDSHYVQGHAFGRVVNSSTNRKRGWRKLGSLKQNKQLCFTWNDGHITNAKEKIIISLLLEGNVRFLSAIHSSCLLALLFPSGSIWKVSAALTSSLHFEMHGNNSDTLFTRLNNNGWCDTIRHTLSHQTSRSLKSLWFNCAHPATRKICVYKSLVNSTRIADNEEF